MDHSVSHMCSCAFVHFVVAEAAKEACFALSGKEWNDRYLYIGFAKKPHATKAKLPKYKNCRVVLVGKLEKRPPEDKLRQHFSMVGTVTNVRMIEDRETRDFRKYVG